jgi:hypothetical protein
MVKKLVYCGLVLLFCLLEASSTYSQTPPDDLSTMLDTIFPGTATITINGSIASVDDMACGSDIWQEPPVLRIPVEDPHEGTAPEIHALSAYAAVTDAPLDTSIAYPAAPDRVFLGRVTVFLVEPVLNELDPYPWENNRHEMTGPRGSANLAVRYGEALTDWNQFSADNGEIVAEVRQNGLAIEHRVAFEFTAHDLQGLAVDVRGVLHNVAIPWFKEPEQHGNFVTLSGLAYAVTDAPVFHVSRAQINDQTQYTVQIDTEAVLRRDPEGARVLVTVLLALFPAEDDEYGGYDAIQTTVFIDGEPLGDYTVVQHPLQWYRLTPGDDTVSAHLSVVLGNSCGDFLMVDALIQDAPVE